MFAFEIETYLGDWKCQKSDMNTNVRFEILSQTLYCIILILYNIYNKL